MKEKIKYPYMKPQIEVSAVELELTILTASGDPTITTPDMEWGSRTRRGVWGNFWYNED